MSDEDNYEFKIEQGIPMPEPSPSGVRKYPMPDLEIGDSFLVPSSSKKNPQKILHASAKHAGIRITVRRRKLERDGEDGVRVWRVE